MHIQRTIRCEKCKHDYVLKTDTRPKYGVVSEYVFENCVNCIKKNDMYEITAQCPDCNHRQIHCEKIN